MTSKIASLSLVTMMGLMTLGLVGCDGTPKDNAMAACGATFANTSQDEDGNSFLGDEEANKQAACQQGVAWADINLYQKHSSHVPALHQFRTEYQVSKSWCGKYENEGQIPNQEACLDGVDMYTALLADSGGYQLNTNYDNDAVLDQSYYQNHNYLTIYDDPDWNDDRWLYYLLYRQAYPEYFPGYRRDSYYYIYGSGPFNNGYGYRRNNFVFIPPSRSVAGVGPTPMTSFGPRAAPRPFSEGSAWYGNSRPGMPGAAPARSSSITSKASSGSASWGRSGSGSLASTGVGKVAGGYSSFSAPSRGSSSGSVGRGGFGGAGDGGSGG